MEQLAKLPPFPSGEAAKDARVGEHTARQEARKQASGRSGQVGI